MKSWHIWDFPDKINIILKDEIHEEFFNYMFKKCGGKRPYARFLGIHQMHIKSMHKKYFKKNGRIYNFYTPNWVFKKSLPLINKDLKRKLENSIAAIKCPGKGIKVFEPKLPIKESPELYRIIAHLIGDGFAGRGKVPYYANTCKELIDQFKKDLQIFGRLKTYERTPDTTPCLMFPRVISDIIRHIFKIEFTRPSKLPKEIFKASEECKKAFLQALFDDEGTTSNSVTIGMSDLNIVNETKKLVESLNLKTGRTTFGKSGYGKGCYYFRISEKNIKKFKDKIGFQHPIKLKRLKMKLKIQKRNKTQRTRPLKWTREKIISSLKEKPRTTVELSNELLLTITGIYLHLNFLKNSKKIKNINCKNKRV